MNMHASEIQSLRERLHDAGFRPLAVYNPDAPGPSPGKRPVGEAWEERARRDPPAVLSEPIRKDALNTGILCDGLRAIDIDIDNPTIGHRARALAIEMLGDAIIRTRSNSARSLLLYRAAEGEPLKRWIKGTHGKIEVLGRGQQFVAFGQHESGVELQWVPEPPGDFCRDALPSVTEQQISEYLAAAADLIGAKPDSAKKPNGADDSDFGHRQSSQSGPSADALDVVAALAAIPNDDVPDWEFWNKLGMATWAATIGSATGFAAWCAWSEKNQAHDPAACRERWRHYPNSPPSEIGAGTLFHMAREAMPSWRKPSEQRAKNDNPARAPIVLVNPAELQNRPVPERQWIVEGWLPISVCTGNYGDGGVGKTLLAQQLQTACATGIPWCGLEALQCKSFALYCEDSEEELHIRQNDINNIFGRSYSELSDMRWISGVGDDWTLVNFTSDGRMHTTPKWDFLVREIKAFGAQIVPLDTATDLFGGNENDRGQVRRFINLLAGLAREINGAVLLNAHPSRDGLRSGNLDGGSTAWSNTFRSRWSLARGECDSDTQPDTSERVLTRRKANYASIGHTLRIRWNRGAFVPVTQQAGVRASAAEEVFMTLLDRCTQAGQRLSDSRNSGNYAPKVFAKRPDREGNTLKDFEAAMHRLFAAKRIAMHTYDRRGCRCIVPVA